MAQYAPFSDCDCGIFWQPDTDDAFLLQSATAAWGMIVEAETADEIIQVWPVICASFNPPNAFALEIFDVTDGLPALTDLFETTYYPGGDLVKNGVWGQGAFSGFAQTQTNVYQAINGVSLTPGTYQPSADQPAWSVDSTSFINEQGGAGYTYFFKVAGIAGQNPANWITRLRHRWAVQRFSNGDDKASVAVQSMLMINGTAFAGDSVTYSDEIAGGHIVTTDWYNNPATGLPWTPDDLLSFDSGTGFQWGFGWQASGTGIPTVTPLIFDSQVIVEAAPTDQRLAIGAYRLDAKFQGWKLSNLFNPDGYAENTSVQLTPGRSYLFEFRRTRYQQGSGNGIALCRLNQPGVPIPGPPNWTSANISLDRQSHRINGIGESQSVVMGLLLAKNGGYSLDSQFYAETAPTGLDSPNSWPDISAFFELSPVDIQHSFYQQFTPTQSDDYGYLRVKCAMATGTVQDELRIRILDVATNTQQGPQIRIVADDLAQPTTAWQVVELRIPDIALTAGTQYYFDVYSATSHRQGWLVQVVNAGKPSGPPGGPPVLSYNTAWGGQTTPKDKLIVYNTQVANPDPGTIVPAAAELILSTIPDTPSDFVAFADTTVCKIEPITIMWTNPPPEPTCGGFLAADIERSDDNGATFQSIAYITDPNVLMVSDYEWRPNPRYRMRVWRGDRVPSDYTDIVTITATREECGLAFVTNQAPELNVWYPDVALGSIPDRDYAFPTDRQVFAPHNRNFQIVYTGLENRGDTWSAMLRVRSGIFNTAGAPCVADPCIDPTLQGVDVFDPLRAISRADVSYVAIINEHGNRWFANVDVTTGKWNVVGEIFTAQIDVIETTDTPAPFDAQAGS